MMKSYKSISVYIIYSVFAHVCEMNVYENNIKNKIKQILRLYIYKYFLLQHKIT